MKKLILIFAALPLVGIAQTKTTVANGDFYNPLTWDCTCLPMDGDSLIVNHDVIMNNGIYYASGRITVNMSGSLMEDATDRAFWADGTGSLVNMGDFSCHLVRLSQNTDNSNMGTLTVDSLWNQGYTMSMGTMQVFDVLNDETGTLHNHGNFNVTNNLNNQGFFHMMGGTTLQVGNDFSNCNIQTMDAWFENHGTVCVMNDFSNCTSDTLAGSGTYFVGGSSSNQGVFTGTFTFYTLSGTVGTPGIIESGVTVTNGFCSIGIKENLIEEIEVYPNPTSSDVFVSENNVSYKLLDYTGKIVSEGVISNNKVEMSRLVQGVYLLQLEDLGAIRLVKVD